MVEYTKELSKKEKFDSILECMKNINKVENCQQMVILLESLVKNLVTAKYIILWIYDHKRKLLCTKIDNEEHTSITDRGLLGKAFREKKAFFANEISRNSDYLAATDNIFDDPIKDIIFLPILDKKDNIKFIFQAMTSKHNIQQFVQSDVDTLNTLIEYIHNIDLESCCRDDLASATQEDKTKEEDILDKIINIFTKPLG